MRVKLQLALAIILALAGLALMAVSFYVPPMGVIDASVLAATGEVFTFSGSLVGIDAHYSYKHGSTHFDNHTQSTPPSRGEMEGGCHGKP